MRGALGIEEELRVVERAAIAFIHTDGHHDSRLPGRIGDDVDCGRRYGHGLIDQPQLLRGQLERSLDKGEVGIVRPDRLGEDSEPYVLAPEFGDLVDNLLSGAITAV